MYQESTSPRDSSFGEHISEAAATGSFDLAHTPLEPPAVGWIELQRDLYTPVDIQQLTADLQALTATERWVRAFLAQPHPNLGRSGAVCPFVPRALSRDTIWLTVIRTAQTDSDEVERVVARFRDIFHLLEPRFGDAALDKAILVILPDVRAEDAAALIDGTQRKLKPAFVERGLMIGEFHPLNDTPGLHNPAFYPLRSPLPMLAIRSMVDSDLPFLVRGFDPPIVRQRYLSAYLKHCAQHAHPSFLEAATSALAAVERELAEQSADGEEADDA